MKNIFTIIGALLIIGAIIALTVHQWSDCLEENSFWTCQRMLLK